MMKERTFSTNFISLPLRQIFLSLLICLSLSIISVAPVLANPIELNPPPEVKTESSPQITTPDTTINEPSDVPPETEETQPEEKADPSLDVTEPVEEQTIDNKTSSFDTTTPTIITVTDSLIPSEKQYENSSISPVILTEETTVQQNQQVPLSIVTINDAHTTTDITTINVLTTQENIDVFAEVFITKEKPTYAPVLKLENENDFIDSYVTIHLQSDTIAFSNPQIQSMTMALKIKKNLTNLSSSIDMQIYALIYHLEPLFTSSSLFIREIQSSGALVVWEPLTPTEIIEDEEYIYYYVDVSSYSATFAIVGTELVEIQPYQLGIPEISWTTIILTIILATVLLIFVLFKTGCIYQVEDNVDKSHKEKYFKDTNRKWSYNIKLTTTPPELRLIRTPNIYFSAHPAPQTITASSRLQESTDEWEEDPMFL